MNEIRVRQIVLASRPHGKVQLNDFRLEEVILPQPGPGELLLKTKYLSLDPYMRGRMDDRRSYAEATAVGSVMPGESVTTVIESRNPNYSEGDIVTCFTGWRTYAISDGTKLRKVNPNGAPTTTALGVLGMPGFTAYSGLKAIGRPAKGETVVVAAASGPVGSLVGQLAQIAGARAVGIAGGPEKCAYIKNEFRFDEAVDHRVADFESQLAKACPDGIDVYFENVGGAILQAVLPILNQFARVPVCGLIAQYDRAAPPGVIDLAGAMRIILSKRLTLRGFINYDFADELYEEFQREIALGIAEGQIRYREDIVDGLENAPKALIDMLDGRNFGKALVRIER
jgi:NADPH-dependent curcumin reductase